MEVKAFGRVMDFLCTNKSVARFIHVTLPVKGKKVSEFLKRYRYKIIVPTAVCALGAVLLLAFTPKNAENSDYYTKGDDTADFGMVLQNYSTFDHSEKTHISVKLSWTDGAVNLEGGRALTRIKAEVFPINLENKEIEWSVSDETIATIDQNGKVEATAAGRVEIFARLKNYDRTAKAKLSVRQSVTGIILPTSTMTLDKGGSARYLSARVFPANASNKNITWHSKNSGVASVDNNGTVRAVGPGMTEIVAVTEDGGFEGRCFVTVVNPAVEVDRVSLQNSEDMSLRVGDSINAIVTVSPPNAKNRTLRWRSDNESCATVSQTGKIHAEGAGEAYITAESVNGKKAVFLVKVESDGEEYIDDIPVSDGTVTYTSYNTTFPQAVRIQMSQYPSPKIWRRGGSVSASEADTAAYMNPNSYYKDAYKYQFLDLSKPSGVSAETLNRYLADKGVLRGMGQVFADAAREYGVNEVYLAVHACLESGNGTSALATGVEVNGETVYNLFGIAAYDSDALGGGSEKAYREGWTSVESAIMGGARWISEYYINSSDTRQNTLYKMLWNPERVGYHQYATDIGWAVKQAVSIGRVLEDMPEAALCYDVPVYSGMLPPEIEN